MGRAAGPGYSGKHFLGSVTETVRNMVSTGVLAAQMNQLIARELSTTVRGAFEAKPGHIERVVFGRTGIKRVGIRGIRPINARMGVLAIEMRQAVIGNIASSDKGTQSWSENSQAPLMRGFTIQVTPNGSGATLTAQLKSGDRYQKTWAQELGLDAG